MLKDDFDCAENSKTGLEEMLFDINEGYKKIRRKRNGVEFNGNTWNYWNDKLLDIRARLNEIDFSN